METKIEAGYLTINKWEKSGKRRAYINGHSRKSLGYIDLNNIDNSESYIRDAALGGCRFSSLERELYMNGISKEEVYERMNK